MAEQLGAFEYSKTRCVDCFELTGPKPTIRSYSWHRVFSLLHEGLEHGVGRVLIELDADSSPHVVGKIVQLAPGRNGH